MRAYQIIEIIIMFNNVLCLFNTLEIFSSCVYDIESLKIDLKGAHTKKKFRAQMKLFFPIK